MPPRDLAGPKVPWFRRVIPEKLFYVPIGLLWGALALRYGSLTLPTAANPRMDVGGLWGESKSQGLALAGPVASGWIARFVVVRLRHEPVGIEAGRALRAMEAAGLAFPIVAKPDVGYQSWGVERIEDAAGLAGYIARFPAGETFILQELVPHDGEAAIFYVRDPDMAVGRIFSMALVYFPHVVGDGRSTLRELILADEALAHKAELHLERMADRLDTVLPEGRTLRLAFAGSIRLGATYRDCRDLVTPELERRIDEIARDVPEFHFGRFDLRFSSLDRLQAGEDFRIVEINGAGAEALHIWDPRTTLRGAYRTLVRQFMLLFATGAANRDRGFRPVGPRVMLRRLRRQERLRRRYPPGA
jgi:hypothetical protein